MIRRYLLALLVFFPSGASARSVTIAAPAAAAGGVVTARLPLIRYWPVRDADGVVQDPSRLLALRFALITAEVQARLTATDLARTEALYRAGHNVSAASLERAQAAQASAASNLAALHAQAVTRYGAAIAAVITRPTGPVAAIALGKAALVELSLGMTSLRSPSRTATARDFGGRTVILRFLGTSGRVPTGLVGQGLYYSGPLLPAGLPLAVQLRDKAAQTGAIVPASAVIYRRRGSAVFVEMAPGKFRLTPIPLTDPVRVHGDLRGYFVSKTVLPQGKPVAVGGAGLLLSINAAQTDHVRPDDD
ncbi:hypothetical protein [Acidiphilium sp.]|uniref:hypothetical protein n=1 Tax=Acidiphilium sp. TaxID=527 RepID=UPI003CFD4601